MIKPNINDYVPHRQGLHSDDKPYVGEELCYCDQYIKRANATDSGAKVTKSGESTAFSKLASRSSDTNELEQAITNIFMTIDNYGTAEEARADIRELIATKEVEAYKKGYIQCGLDGIDEFNRLEGDI